MRNWSTDTQNLQTDPEKYSIWMLEQQLNYGLSEGEKIDRLLLEKYMPILNIDNDTRNFLEYLLYEKKPS
ncbi:MAG: hypothetical protein LBC80_00380 [Treponema sp.]|jgi:hypothetical protein|nr:hypothetical protein [Treponema sp.]